MRNKTGSINKDIDTEICKRDADKITYRHVKVIRLKLVCHLSERLQCVFFLGLLEPERLCLKVMMVIIIIIIVICHLHNYHHLQAC